MANGVESDDEIVREAGTDSDTDDYQSSIASESDSDLESDDDHPTGRSEIVTPSSAQSPPPPDLSGPVSSSKGTPLKEPLLNGNNGPFVRATDWAQMVAEDKVDADLPVIDFADFDGKTFSQPKSSVPPPKSRKHQKHGKKPATAAPSIPSPVEPPAKLETVEPPIPETETPVASTSRHSSKERRPSRLRGQTPRQAYQHRLESDPSFVPTVGEFWGHDDRLLDKDLRSLSGWWRGRWQSRGRGRGVFSTRGRRPFLPGPSPSAHGPENAEGEDDFGAAPSAEVPPIERTWTHDGFEEMKRREEHRQPQKQDSSQDAPLSPPQRGFPFRGRGGWFGTRGRGGFTRGGSVSSPTGSRAGPTTGHPSGRPWYAMKPEKVWTKQHETFLYFDPSLKPRQGQGPGLRIKLPGKPEQVIRAPPRSQTVAGVSKTPQTQAGSTASSHDSGVVFTVRIPRTSGKQKAAERAPAASTEEAPVAVTKEAATTVAELSIEDVFKVRPSAVPNHVPLVSSTASESHPAPSVPDSQPEPAPLPLPAVAFVPSPTQSISHHSQSSAQQQLEQIFSPVAEVSSTISAQIEETVLRNPPSANIHAPAPQSPEVPRLAPPALPPLQTNFSPVPPTSPPYGSPYPYAPALPPGVAISQHGIPYEIATGRAVYLQPTPPPTMFTPRPMMQMGPPGGMPFVPTHMHHPSVPSPDFLAPSQSPPVNGFVDPSSGIPIFTPARHSSRIEIRAPTDRPEGKGSKGSHGPSSLRSSSAEHSKPTVSSVPSFFPPSESAPSDQTAASPSEPSQPVYQAVDPSMVSYNPYQQPYYYPGQYGYPPAYMDMSPQVVNYEMYPADPRPSQSQPLIYY